MFTMLLSAFEPFGGDPENASYEAVSRIPDDLDGNVRVVKRTLPVVFDAAPRALRDALKEVSPDVVVCVGEAGSRSDITPETRAINLACASLPDNSGYVATGERLDEGSEFLASRLPNEAIVEKLSAASLPAKLSDDAGAYLCNAVMRCALREFDGPAGFIHVPAVRTIGRASVGAETDAGTASGADDRSGGQGESGHSLTFDDLAHGLEIAIKTIYQTSSLGR